MIEFEPNYITFDCYGTLTAFGMSALTRKLLADRVPQGMPDDLWKRVRGQYPEQHPFLNLNNAAVSPPPLAVEDATIDALRLVNRNPDYTMWTVLDGALPAVKEQLSALMDCKPTEIALNRNSTEGLCTVIFGLPLAAGDQVLLSAWEYPSVRTSWLQRQQRDGVDIVLVDFDLMDSDDEIVDAYAAAITPRTRVIQLTHMSHWTGRVLPAKRLCALAQAHDIVTIVDGAQTFAQMPVSFRDLGCDVFVTSLHKWLGAPVGNGMLVVDEKHIDATWPLLGPFDPEPLGIDKFDHWSLGTYNSALQAGIAPAIRLHQEIGTHRIHARLQELTRYWVAQARDIPGFRLHTPLEQGNFGAVSLFSIDGLDSMALEQHLRNTHGIHVKYRQVRELEGLRVSPHIYMLEDELDRFVWTLEQVVQEAQSDLRSKGHG